MSIRSGGACLALLVLLCGCGGGGGGGGGGKNNSPNVPPNANAGLDQTVFRNSLVTLEGGGSTDANGNQLSYRWSQLDGPAVAMTGTNSARPTFTAPAATGTLTFSLVVSDGVAESTADSISVTVQNRVATSNAGADRQTTLGQTIVLDGRSSSDPDADALTYLWRQVEGAPVVFTDNRDGTLTLQLPNVPRAVTFGLIVSDGELRSAEDLVTVSVTPTGTNAAPVADAGFPKVVPRRRVVYLDGFAQDPDHQPVTLRWRQVSGTPVTLSSDRVTRPSFTTPAVATVLQFEVVANDGALTSTPATVAIDVRNFAPTLESLEFDPATPKATDSVTAAATFTDPDGDPITLTYAWSRNTTPLSITAADLPPGNVIRGDSLRVHVTASDGELATTESYSALVANSLPMFAASPPESVEYGSAFAFQITATDPDGDPIQYQIKYGPSGMRVDAAGRVTWTPSQPMFERSVPVHYGIGSTDTDDALLTDTVLLTDADRSYPLKRAGLELPADRNAFRVTDLNADGTDDVLVASITTIYEYAREGSGYVQRWAYPFQLDRSSIRAIAAGDTGGSAHQEIFIATQGGLVVQLDGDSRHRVASYALAEGTGCLNLEVADVDADGERDLVCLARATQYGSGNRVVVFDTATHMQKWATPTLNNAASLAVGNVDADAALEVVTSDGFVFDGVAGTNEWAYSNGFGNNIRIADIDGNGRAEVLGSNDYSPNIGVRAFDVVQRAMVMTIPLTSSVTFSTADVDSDGTAEVIVATFYPYRLVGYRRNAGTGLPEVAFDTDALGYQVNAIGVGDVDGDGAKEIVWMPNVSPGGLKLAVAGFNPTLAVEWTSGATDALAGPFSFGGIARLSATQSRAMFVPSRMGSSSGSRLVAMNPLDGTMQFSNLLNSSTYGDIPIAVSDYDNDAIDELLVGLNSSSSSLIAYDFLANAEEWSSGLLGYSQGEIVGVEHSDVNGDGHEDAIFLTYSGYVSVYSVSNQTLLWRSPQVLGRSLAVGDLDGDGVAEIVVAAYDELVVYGRVSSNGTFAERASFSGDEFTDVLIADTDGDSSVEIYTVSGRYSESRVRRFDRDLVQLQTYTVPLTGASLFLEHSTSSRKNILIAADSGIYSNTSDSGVYVVDPITGAEIWRSPDIGAIPPSSLQYIDVNGDGERELVFGSNRGMFVTR